MLKTWSCCPCVEKAHLRCVEQVFTVFLGSKPSDPVGKEIGKRFLILTVSSHTILKDLRPLFSTGHYFVFLQNSSFIIVFVQPLRACILGPPASGKTLVIKQLCDHYKLHHIKIQDVIDEAVEKLVRFY